MASLMLPRGLVAGFVPSTACTAALRRNDHVPDPPIRLQTTANAVLAANVLSEDECTILSTELTSQRWVRANKNGFCAQDGEVTGSQRATLYSQEFASILFTRLADTSKLLNPDVPKGWEPAGINPAFRAIYYAPGGTVLPHYDAPHVWSAVRKTHYTVVLYITSGLGGATSFLRDHLQDPTFTDWTRPAEPQEKELAVDPLPGAALLFPHRVLHEGSAAVTPKLVLRTDVIIQRIPLHRGAT